MWILIFGIITCKLVYLITFYFIICLFFIKNYYMLGLKFYLKLSRLFIKLLNSYNMIYTA